MEAGASTAIAVDNEAANGVGEEEVTRATDHSQQGPESETPAAVDKEVAN
jgi:hypothetical protein